jgi:hypothetical protein
MGIRLLTLAAGLSHKSESTIWRMRADLIDPVAFGRFLRFTAAGLDFDAMLEAKAKDLARRNSGRS